MNNQFVASLNKQKETAEEEISRRDNIINAQERQLKKIADESLDRINSLERKYKLIVDENKDYIDKISQMKTSSDQKTLALETTKAEVQRLREIADKLVEKTKQLENEKDSLLNKHQLDRDSYDKKIKILETGQRNRDQEFVKYKDDSIKLVQVESKYRDEISRLNDQLLRVKTELETKSGTLEDIQTKFTALQANAHQLLLKNKDLDIDLDKKDKELRISKNELEIANRNANSSFTEMTKFRNNMNEEMKAKMADKDKQIADLLRKVSHAEQSIKLLEQNREQLTHKLNTAVTERDNTKQLIDTFSGPNSEYKLKCKELEKLKEDLDNIKKQFATTI
ncbi:MAG: hypothetical protein JSS09_09210, partial [Verrucomicrobia bacterium]|nr:hypothetical protein [Verrucomicrobiota bacterium]